MKNRWINFFIQDRSLQLGIVALLALVFLSSWLYKDLGARQVRLAKLKQELAKANQTLKEIPQLEERLKALQEKAVIAEARPKEINFALRGVFIQENAPVALIGEDMYRENDSIDKFIITKITPNYVVLEDKTTQQQSILRIPE